jgi:hypothetical protein
MDTYLNFRTLEISNLRMSPTDILIQVLYIFVQRLLKHFCLSLHKTKVSISGYQ